MNPLQPSVFEMTVEVLGILHLILLLAAIITILRSTVYSAGPKTLLVLLSVVIPIVGPILALSMCRLPGRVTTT
jgi:hypothetical protein